MVQHAAERLPDNSTSDRVLAKKREIVEAASRVFRRRGLHATGMRDIAAELGMAVGNLYYYFADKEELLAFVQDEALSSLLGIAAEIRALSEPPSQKLLRLLEEHVVCLNDPLEGTPGSLAHLEVEALGEPRRQAALGRRDAYERTIRELIEEGIAAGELHAPDPHVAALILLGALNWTVKWFRAEGPKSAREIGRVAAAFLVRGLVARTPDREANGEAAEEFARLASEWQRDTAHLSSPTQKALHPAYQRIIGMGPSAIGPILEELKNLPSQWFWALKAITGEDPVPPHLRGNVRAMADAWLQWGLERGYH